MAIETLYTSEMAEWYDQMYCGSRYTKKEVQFLAKLFGKYKAKSVLDVACGTGRHAIALKKQGFDVVGIDLEPGMIDYAQTRALKEHLDINFKVQDMRNIKLHKKFDAAFVFFSAFAYLTNNHDVLTALHSIHRHLKKNGVLIIETFFAWPNIVQGKFRRKTFDRAPKLKDKTYVGINEHSLDIIDNFLFVTTTHKRTLGGKKLKTLKDKMSVCLRIFFPQELDLFFCLSGFKNVQFYGDIEGRKLSKKHHQRLIAVAQKG